MPVPRSLTIAGLPNVLDADVVTITAGAEGADMLAGNLKDWQHPSQLAELTGFTIAAGETILPPHKTWWEIVFGSAPVPLVRALGLGRHDSLVPGDQIRVVGVSSGSLPPVRSDEIPVVAIDDSDNLNSTDETRIDEGIEASDASTISSATQGDAWMLLSYGGAPASAPAVGDEYQCFLVMVRVGHTSAGPEDFGSIKLTLYENGSPVRDLGTKITKETACYIFPWDAGWLADPTCADMQVRVDIFDPDAVGGSIRVDNVPWQVMNQTDVDTADADSGWITIPGSELEADFGNTAVEEELELPTLTVHYLDTLTPITKARIEIRADGVGYFNTFLQTPPRTPARFIDAGYAIVHPVWEAPCQFVDGTELDAIPTFVGDEESIDGANHKTLQYQHRFFRVKFNHMDKAKADALFRRLNLSQGRSLLVSLFPDSSTRSGDIYTMLCTAESLSPHVMTNYHFDGVGTSHTFECTFLEKLG